MNDAENTSGSSWIPNPEFSPRSVLGPRSSDYPHEEYVRNDEGFSARPFSHEEYAYGEPRMGQGTLPVSEERTWAILAHISGFVAMLISAGGLGFVGPLAIWAAYKDRSPYVREAAARSFNFFLAIEIGAVVCWVMFFTVILIPVALIGLAMIFLSGLIFPIRAAMAASRSKLGSYPFEVRVLS